jgi:hypothetical protein
LLLLAMSQSTDGPTAKQHHALKDLVATLDEKSRRLVVGLLAKQQGQGGITRLARITGLSRDTIRRINRASDDAAGISVASSLKADSRLFTQAVRNTTDGISALQISQGALESLGTISTRLKELAEQGASGLYGAAQRSSLDSEAQSLLAEYQRILDSASFNGRRQFDAGSPTIVLQIGSDGSSASQIEINTGARSSLVTTTHALGTFQDRVTNRRRGLARPRRCCPAHPWGQARYRPGMRSRR